MFDMRAASANTSLKQFLTRKQTLFMLNRFVWVGEVLCCLKSNLVINLIFIFSLGSFFTGLTFFQRDCLFTTNFFNMKYFTEFQLSTFVIHVKGYFFLISLYSSYILQQRRILFYTIQTNAAKISFCCLSYSINGTPSVWMFDGIWLF